MLVFIVLVHLVVNLLFLVKRHASVNTEVHIQITYLTWSCILYIYFKFWRMWYPVSPPSCKQEYLSLYPSLVHQFSYIGWWTNWHILSASLQVLLYAILLMILFSPFDMFYISSRFYFLRTVLRIILPFSMLQTLWLPWLVFYFCCININIFLNGF
jgi:hypothetical protein